MQKLSRWLLVMCLVAVLSVFLPGVSQAQDEKVVNIGLIEEPATLDHRNYALTPSTFAVVWQIYEPLVYHDTRDDSLMPGLAESWEQLSETSYQFNLRQGVTWHDGEPFTAEDVAWSYTRTPNRVAQYGLDPETPVEIIDDHTIIVNTDGPQGPFLRQNLALNMYILPEHIYEPYYTEARNAEYEATTDEDGNEITAEQAKADALFSIDRGDDWVEPPTFIGTGPFKYVSWDRGTEIVLEANDDYWGGRPNIDKLAYSFVEDSTSRVIGLESGDFDLILDVTATDVERLQSVDDVEVLVSPGLGYTMLTMNQAVPELQDPRVRQAIAYAVDQDEIVTLFEGLATRTCGPLSVNSGYYNEDVNCYTYDPDTARALLDEAGWDGSKTLVLTVTSSDSDTALLIQQYLGDVGVDVEINEVDAATFRTTVRGTESELAIQGFGNVVDPDHMYWVFHTDTLGGSIFSYQDDRVNELLADAQKLANPDTRLVMYNEAQDLIVDQDVPAVFLYSSADLRAYRSDRLVGMEPMPRPTDVFFWLRTADVVE
ncbi:MAG: ABC transporter substrate-binding protein [Anaerolineae bacterium]|nr:ABC transporter substrate-binding protein [Anaerolineae bacterium]